MSNFVQELPADATIKAIVKEKGRQHDAKGSWLSRVGQNLAAGAMLVEEAAMGRKGLGVPKAYTEAISLSPLLNKSHVDTEGFVEVRLPITKLASGPISAMGYGKAAEKGDFVTFRMRWLDFAALKRTWVGSDSLWEGGRCDSTSSYHFKCSSDKAAVYEPIGAKQVMKIERCQDILDTWKQYYGEDSLYDDLCDRCPTVKKLRAVHGVNVPTEAAYALRVQTIRLKQSEILTRLAFDEAASSDIHGYSFQGGTVHANGSSKALSGDGVVPLSSLEECRNWAKAGLDSELTSIPGVEHRAILADAHFHQIIKDSVLLKGRQSMQQEPPLRFSIAGTFSNWKPEQMTWDGACFVRVLSIGPNGWESFQILLDSSWDKVFYPNVKDAGPTVPHSILGPDNHNAGKDWTIGKNRGKLLEGLLRPGSAFKVKLELNSGKPQSVTWEPFSLVEVLRAKGTWQMQKRGAWSDLPAECSVTLNSELALARPSAEMQIQQQRCRIDLLNMQLINFATKEQVPVQSDEFEDELHGLFSNDVGAKFKRPSESHDTLYILLRCHGANHID